MAYSLTTRMSKRVNYRGEPAKRAKKASYKSTKVNYEQLQKNSGEKKGMDTNIALSPVITTTNTNASSFTLNLVRPGSASYNRVGRKIFCKSVRLKGNMTFEYGDQATTLIVFGLYCRMVVIWDKQPSGTVPNWDDIFLNTDQAGTESSAVLAQPAYDNMSRFQILRDKVIECVPQSDPPTGGSNNTVHAKMPFDEYIKLGNRTTVFQGQSSPCTIADISSGALYVFFRANLQNTNEAEVNIDDAWARLRYSD